MEAPDGATPDPWAGVLLSDEEPCMPAGVPDGHDVRDAISAATPVTSTKEDPA